VGTTIVGSFGEVLNGGVGDDASASVEWRATSADWRGVRWWEGGSRWRGDRMRPSRARERLGGSELA
jgi:hypothetical protein